MNTPSPNLEHTTAMLRYESEKKSPALAAIINFFFPGLGEAYAGNVAGGIIVFVVILIAGLFTFGIVYGIAAFIGIFTGISSAQTYNKELALELSGEGKPANVAPIGIEAMTDDEIRAMAKRKFWYNVAGAVCVGVFALIVFGYYMWASLAK